MTTRRGFLSLLAAAPFAAPAVAKAAAAERYTSGVSRFVGHCGGNSFGMLGEMTTESLFTPTQMRVLTLTMEKGEMHGDVDQVLRLDRRFVPVSPLDDPHDPVPDYFC